MQMILHGGNARALLYEALELAKKKQFKEAAAKLQEADDELEKGHEMQTQLLQREAGGAAQTASFLVAHAMDHLMNASTEKGLISEIIELRKELNCHPRESGDPSMSK